MKQRRLLSAASVLLVLMCLTPAVAQTQPLGGSVTTAGSLQKMEDAKEKERKDKERKEEEARIEAEKRKKAEEDKKREAEEAKAKEESARKEQERKDQEKREIERKEQERKDQEKRELERKEQERKEQEQKEIERKKEEDRLKEERRKEEEARLEAEKRKRVERQRERERERDRYRHDHPSDNTYYRPGYPDTRDETVIIVTPPPQRVDNTPTAPPASTPPPAANTPKPSSTAGTAGPSGTPAPVQTIPPPRRYYRPVEPQRSYASVLFAPGSSDRKSAVGVQFMSNRNIGLGLWFSGSLGQDDDVIDATIPHDDYYTESRIGTYGIEALFAAGSDAAMIIFGAGVTVEQTTYTDISNATGWKWNGGESSEVRPAAQLGLRLRVGGRVSLQAGYDTAQSAFFGLSASF